MEEMIIFTQTYDLLNWLLPKAEHFPKLYRTTLTQRMMDVVLDFQEALYDALSQGGTTRHKHLRTADAHLNKLRLYLRLAHQWKWLSDGQYHHVSHMITQIGRLLGGWIQQSKPPSS
jgi:16S rRNA U516 pseudouridylate synthase RsuA-like enzyme